MCILSFEVDATVWSVGRYEPLKLLQDRHVCMLQMHFATSVYINMAPLCTSMENERKLQQVFCLTEN